MAVIALFSTSPFGADRTGSVVLSLLERLLPAAGADSLHGLHVLVRKMGHVVEYGLLGALWARALARRRPATAGADWAAWAAVALAAGYAVVDEAVFQALTPNRSPSGLDVAVDTAGAAIGAAALRGRDAAVRPVLRLGVWAAGAVAAGSVAAAVLDWSLGLPAWDLVAGALGAGGLALGLRRAAARARPADSRGFPAAVAGVSSSSRASPPGTRV
jgi:VanZ family protein